MPNYQTTLQAQFRSSSSQTTFLDRNIVRESLIVQNLAVTASAPLTASSSKMSSIGGHCTSTTTTACGTMQHADWVQGPNQYQQNQQANGNVSTKDAQANGARKRRPRTGKSLSEALLFAEHEENMLCTKIVLNVRNNFCSQHVLSSHVLQKEELLTKIYLYACKLLSFK